MEIFAEIELQYTWKKLSIDEVFKDADSIPAANRFRLFFRLIRPFSAYFWDQSRHQSYPGRIRTRKDPANLAADRKNILKKPLSIEFTLSMSLPQPSRVKNEDSI